MDGALWQRGGGAAGVVRHKASRSRRAEHAVHRATCLLKAFWKALGAEVLRFEALAFSLHYSTNWSHPSSKSEICGQV